MTSSAFSLNHSTNSATTADEHNYNIPKSDSQNDGWASTGHDYINPFMHKLDIYDPLDIAKIYVLTVILFPIRVVGCFISLVSAWMFACIGLYGMTPDDLKLKPIGGWRRHLQNAAAASMRLMFASGSFHSIKFKGSPANSKDAPILVMAPHSSFADSIIVVATGPPSIVAKRETSEIPLLGRIIDFSQPIYVVREDPNSRQNTIREIMYRARSEDNWPQVVIFPEGTCTNRTALIKFKPGAFYPGVPVQPVLLKFPNKHDTFTWTWDGPGVFKLLWLTIASFYNNCEIEFLPVYNPSEEEKADANLYAKNVRKVMAQALGIPTSEFSFEDVIVMNKAKDMRIPFPGDIVIIERTLQQLGLFDDDDKLTTELVAKYTSFPNDIIDIRTFSDLLNIGLTNVQFQKLFDLLDHNKTNAISLKSFLLCSLFCKYKTEKLIDFLRAITNIYSASSQTISSESFKKLMRHYSKLPDDNSDILFASIDHTNRGTISFDEFENYCSQKPDYSLLFKKEDQIRATRK